MMASSKTRRRSHAKTKHGASHKSELGTGFADLERALLAAAQEFSSDAQPLGELLTNIVSDVDRAARERLEIFPVAHHSPASAVHMVRRLRAHPPKVIFMEMCEDLMASVAGLSDSNLPVAMQAFAGDAPMYPPEWSPLSVIAPLTELSAEYQAIACASQNPHVTLVFVDRSVDHVYQRLERTERGLQDALPTSSASDDDEDTAGLHGSAIGVELGRILPSLGDFLDFLLANASVAHFSEWWSLYVEQPTLSASYESYRRVMFLIGSLIRRLGSTERAIENDRMRERYMWTRMKAYLEEHRVDAEDAIYICGAAHTASDVDEFGVDSAVCWDIPARTSTEWLYGLIPSSYSAIEHQFGHPRGTISLAAETWKKAITALSLKPFKLARSSTGKRKKTTKRKRAPRTEVEATGETFGDATASEFLNMLTSPPTLVEQDREQLLSWCTNIVALARKNGYLASTADSIAIYHHALLLANLRSRRHPSPGDFADAAVTCLEKSRVPGKRNVARLCEVLLGADKVGQVGYSSLPPLVKNILDRLAPTGVRAKKTTITRWVVDFTHNPELLPCSDLLWRLHYLLAGSKVARPIMGERKLGGKAIQESWDIKTGGPEQRHLIELAYRGVTVEQVLENQLRAQAMSANATVLRALEATTASILLLDSPRLTEALGSRIVRLLEASVGADDAEAITEQTRTLLEYYRSTLQGVPNWLHELISTGYQHYATLLPDVFADRGTSPEKVAGMLSFVIQLEPTALTIGCSRSQLVIAIEQAAGITETPDKQGLLWAAEWYVEIQDEDGVRAAFDQVLASPMTRAAYPSYLSGFLLALSFKAFYARLGVELLSKAFCELPDAVLMPWLPGLIESLRPRAGDIMPALLTEANILVPTTLSATDTWEPPWAGVERASTEQDDVRAMETASAIERSAEEVSVHQLLASYPAGTDAYAAMFGLRGEWRASEPGATDASDTGRSAASTDVSAPSPVEAGTRQLLSEHGHAMLAFVAHLSPELAKK